MIKMKFTDVTSDNQETVSIIKYTGIGVETVKVLEKGETRIVCGLGESHKHVSVSNPVRKIKKSEIEYVVKRIMKVNPSDVKMYVSPRGILHFSWAIKH
jgi:hypothetical protein